MCLVFIDADAKAYLSKACGCGGAGMPCPPATYPTKTTPRGFRWLQRDKVSTTNVPLPSRAGTSVSRSLHSSLRLYPASLGAHLFSICSRWRRDAGEALSYGWRVTARCAHGKRDGMKSIKECVYRAELDMETLVWTRGRSFPLSRLETRLRCPMCGSRDVRLIFTVPREAQTVRGAKSGPK